MKAACRLLKKTSVRGIYKLLHPHLASTCIASRVCRFDQSLLPSFVASWSDGWMDQCKELSFLPSFLFNCLISSLMGAYLTADKASKWKDVSSLCRFGCGVSDSNVHVLSSCSFLRKVSRLCDDCFHVFHDIDLAHRRGLNLLRLNVEKEKFRISFSALACFLYALWSAHRSGADLFGSLVVFRDSLKRSLRRMKLTLDYPLAIDVQSDEDVLSLYYKSCRHFTFCISTNLVMTSL